MRLSKNIPKLRFKEFNEAWTIEKLGNVFLIFNGYAFSSSDAREEGCRWVKIADVGINEMNHESSSYLPIDYIKKYSKFLLREGDYVVALTRPILGGKLKIARIDKTLDHSLLNQRVGKLVSENDLTFVYSLLQKESLIARIENRIAGTDPPNLSPIEINSLYQSIPSLPEQQKIASFLSAIDEKIQQLTRKKELLEQYKKGVMQQLFSGKLRFKGFGNKWQYTTYDKLTTLVTNGFVGKAKDHYVEDNGVLYIQGYNVHVNGFNFFGIKKVSKQFHIKNKKSALQLNDLLTIQTGDIGVTTIVPEKLVGANCHALIISRFDPKIAEPKFYLHFLNSSRGRKILKVIETGTTMKHLNVGDILKIGVPVPPLKEQQKIASYLCSLDTKIESVATQITQSQTFKKGLLQQMFV